MSRELHKAREAVRQAKLRIAEKLIDYQLADALSHGQQVHLDVLKRVASNDHEITEMAAEYYRFMLIIREM